MSLGRYPAALGCAPQVHLPAVMPGRLVALHPSAAGAGAKQVMATRQQQAHDVVRQGPCGGWDEDRRAGTKALEWKWGKGCELHSHVQQAGRRQRCHACHMDAVAHRHQHVCKGPPDNNTQLANSM